MGDLKALLKEARKLIDENNYKEAQECCKNILRKDKQNYFGLILLGKSLENTDQAPLAFQKAIASKPDHPLAWQGLANYYERKEETSSKLKLLAVYKEILKLQLEDDKALEVLDKYGQLGCILKESDCIGTLINYISENKNEKLSNAAKHQLIELLKVDVECGEKYINLVVNVLNERPQNNHSETLQMITGKVIAQKSNVALAVQEIVNLKYFSDNVVLREWLCSYLCNKFIKKMTFGDLNIEIYEGKVTCGIENSVYPALLKSMIEFDKGNFLEAFKQCVPLVNYQQPNVTEVTFILKCTIMLKKWSVTQKLANMFLNKVKDSHFANDLKKFLFVSYSKQQKWKQAISATKDMPIELFTSDEQAMLAECYIENNESADELLENLKNTEYHILLQALILLKQSKFEETVDLLENVKDTSSKKFYIGRAFWGMQDYQKSLECFLKAAKLDPEHADTFFYLGNYYLMKKFLVKAKKCYEKAYDLNDTNTKIVKQLSTTYSYLNLKEIDFKFLVAAERSLQANEPWLYFKLGLHYLNRREWENAIINFRIVIKSDYNNVTALECLADAYYSRGSYTSALRAYNKVIAMDPNKCSYCLTRIGYIYTLLTQYEDAIITFKKVLLIDPFSILALKGMAETWMRIAKKKVTAKLYGTARDCAQYAVDYIITALLKEKKLTCFWKLLGDTLIFITKLPNIFAYVYTKDLLYGDGEIVKKEKIDIFPQAISCYSHIAKQKQEFASYDLASVYLDYYHETKKEIDCHISFNLAIACVKDKPTAWRNWNLLGKICLFKKRYDIAQHCFIKALLVTRKWAVAKIWCNLGTLYLKIKLYKLANYCFWRGQSTLPSYPQSWIGQALIAESIREEEAMDLFRHASRLGYHPESALGYADWVCRTLKDNKYIEDPQYKYVIDGLYAINYAIDLIEWFSNYEPNNACACNILGILQERSGLLRAALKSYEKALQYAENDKKNIILLNVGRILLRMEKYEEAVKVYKAITEASLNSTCGLALALFKKGLYEESYSVYDTALHWLSNDDYEKADLLVAMAGIMYMFKGADDAKTVLFHSIQISQTKPTAHSLFGICSLGLIHSDQSLTKLALSELKKYETDINFGFHIGFLKSYPFISEGNVEQAIKLLSDSLHDHPNNGLLWFYMAEYCLKTTTKVKIASHFAQRAMCSNNNSSCKFDSAKIITTASIAEHIAGDKDKAFIFAKKGLHMYPNSAEVWAALILSLLTQKQWLDRRDWMVTGANYMRRHLNISRPLSRWVSLLEKRLSK